eukprot:CAMPEP_0119106776 /NCGR_PEP_ID=MMETSP1180-20130426/6312_1 /TAXON_ID=3052 ORGANISM="Chlamydomonas cf sp, Strain CCMP681" /NCGR_SAMPLE_ID=MMETSP1180 /ASSEMBLY_ACC=CAM_ASM_000741 /LENGTH=314 /DNA_ID=CAMNT_0007092163 /DNA_START=58 /DNA_END=1002 /DNA_ORIENTATION=+
MATALGTARIFDLTKMLTAKLSTGTHIPLVGLGTWKSARGEVKDAVITAVKLGYRHIDCAAVYQNEGEVGEALQELFKSGVVKREDLWITSKLWNSEHAPEKVEKAARQTLKDLQLEYMDLYLIHWPLIDPPIIDTWRAMEALSDKGLAKAIGVSNFGIKKLTALLAEARIPPAVNQVEAHPYNRNSELLEWCTAHGIHLTAYSPLGSGDSAAMMGRADSTPSPLADPVVAQIAESLGKTTGQILIRWACQRGTSVLPKSVKPERIASNLDVQTWSIPEDMMAKLNNLQQIRMLPGTFLVKPSGPFESVTELWA